MSFKASISLLIFCLDDLFIDGSGMLKSPTIIVLLLISPFMSVNIFFMYVSAPMLGAYIFIIVKCSWIDSLIHYVMSFFVSCNSLCFKVYFVSYKYCYPGFLFFPFAWNTFFYPLTFSLCMSLDMPCVSCRQHI